MNREEFDDEVNNITSRDEVLRFVHNAVLALFILAILAMLWCCNGGY
jgi:hypothetical protein